MRKRRNKKVILGSVAGLDAVAITILACCVESESKLVYILLAVCMAWLALFVYANKPK